jgi:endonuclease/exonuclease/phosphatase family metal-dependent hydrolase
MAAAKPDGSVAARIHDHAREWPQPSDHAPVSVDLAVL